MCLKFIAVNSDQIELQFLSEEGIACTEPVIEKKLEWKSIQVTEYRLYLVR